MSDKFTFKFGTVEVVLTDANGEETKWFIPSEFIKMVEGTAFWNLRTHKGAANRLLTTYVEDKDPSRLYRTLSRTNVVEQIASAKTRAKQEIISDGKFDAHDNSRWRMKKRFTKNLLTIPEVIDVHVPTIAGVEGIDMQALSMHKGLWIELTHGNLMYITKAMAAQVAEGGIDKGRRRGVKRKSAPQDEDSDASIHDEGVDGECDDDVEVGGTELDDGCVEDSEVEVDAVASEPYCSTPLNDVEVRGTEFDEGCVNASEVEVDAVAREPYCSTPLKKRQSSLFEMFRVGA